MMVLVDTSAWTEPILHELTAGARSPRRAADLRALLLRGPILAVEGLQDWEVAAQLHLSARSRGLIVRSSIDCLIAAVVLRTGSPVLARDRGFDALAQVSDLVVEHPQGRCAPGQQTAAVYDHAAAGRTFRIRAQARPPQEPLPEWCALSSAGRTRRTPEIRRVRQLCGQRMHAVCAPRRSTFFEDVLLETLNACFQILVRSAGRLAPTSRATTTRTGATSSTAAVTPQISSDLVGSNSSPSVCAISMLTPEAACQHSGQTPSRRAAGGRTGPTSR